MLKLKRKGMFFTSQKTHIQSIPTGCDLLELSMGAGWPLGRMVNVIGDKSTGKTLLAIEAMACFRMTYPKGLIVYIEAEAAFDDEYAGVLGLNMKGIQRPEIDTVEGLFEKLKEICEDYTDQPCLVIVDSLDALSDEAEKKRKITEDTYGGSKPKQLGQLFRRLIKPLQKSQVCLFIISQVRDNIGVAFGEKHKRSGGRAMDFYASICLWLAHMGQIKKTVRGQTRTIGVRIKAKCKKNKIGIPFRECDFPILFGYGIDNDEANADFLKMLKVPRPKGSEELRERVKQEWYALERDFLPKRERKYR